MKRSLTLLVLILISCNSLENKVEPDKSKHNGLQELESNYKFKTLYSKEKIDEAREQSDLIADADQFLSEIMGYNKEFYLLVISDKDWKKNAYSPVVGMPEYYKGNLIVGAGENNMALGYKEMIESLPEHITSDLKMIYTNSQGDFDMSLFFDKLSIHELTHNYQDPKNQEGYSMSRWLEEIHANMGLYAYYKSKRSTELKYILGLVNFSLNNPPPDLTYKSLADFNAYYYDMNVSNYGYYQMKFTKTAQVLIDSLGNNVLKPLNEFIIKYDQTWKEKLNKNEFKNKLAEEVDPYIVEVINNW